jgi:hypothetical protein
MLHEQIMNKSNSQNTHDLDLEKKPPQLFYNIIDY